MAKKGKKLQTATSKLEAGKRYEVSEAVKLLKEVSYEKFDATVEFSCKLDIDPRQADQNLRGAIVLPHGTGKTQRILVFAKGDKAKAAEAAGATYVGSDEYVNKVQEGWLDFDVVVATPDMMGQVGRLGRILGPRGLMPNPKTGTVTMDVEKAVNEINAGKVEYRTDKQGNIQIPVGKVSFNETDIIDNVKSIYARIVKIRPATVKGIYVKNVTVSSTMGPGIKVDLGSLE